MLIELVTCCRRRFQSFEKLLLNIDAESLTTAWYTKAHTVRNYSKTQYGDENFLCSTLEWKRKWWVLASSVIHEFITRSSGYQIIKPYSQDSCQNYDSAKTYCKRLWATVKSTKTGDEGYSKFEFCNLYNDNVGHFVHYFWMYWTLLARESNDGRRLCIQISVRGW